MMTYQFCKELKVIEIQNTNTLLRKQNFKKEYNFFLTSYAWKLIIYFSFILFATATSILGHCWWASLLPWIQAFLRPLQSTQLQVSSKVMKIVKFKGA